MSSRLYPLVAIGQLALFAAGCSMIPGGGSRPEAAAPAPLPPAPSGSVTTAPLPPPVEAPAAPAAGEPSGLAALDPALRAGTEGAAPPAAPATPPAAAVEVGRTDLLGGWQVASAGDSCQLFMTLTTWSGGYRATTKGCQNATLTQVSAWNMEGSQVQLISDSGATLARLYPLTKTQFNGQTEGGGPISFTR